MASYGRGIAGGAHSGGTNYGSVESKNAQSFLNPTERGQWETATQTLQSGGMSDAVRQKAERRLAGGKVNKSFRQLTKGFQGMIGAEKQIGKLREGAAGRALGAFHKQGMQLSKPWQLKKPAGLLNTTEINPYDYSPWMDKKPKPGLKKGLTDALGYGSGGRIGTKGQLADVVAGRGFAPTLQWQQHTAQQPAGFQDPSQRFQATPLKKGGGAYLPTLPQWDGSAFTESQFEWDPENVGGFQLTGGVEGFGDVDAPWSDYEFNS